MSTELQKLVTEFKDLGAEKRVPPSASEHLSFEAFSALQSEGEDIVRGEVALTEEEKTVRLRHIVDQLRLEFKTWSK